MAAGGAGGPAMLGAEVIEIDSVDVGTAAGQLQIAVGQLAKHVATVEAFDERGKRCHAERVPAPDLTVDYFLAWTHESVLVRIVALDGGGKPFGEAEVPVLPAGF